MLKPRGRMTICFMIFLSVIIFIGCAEDNPSGPVPPTCRIISPVDGQSVADTVMIEIEAEDLIQISRVRLYIDGDLVFDDANEPYEYEWITRVYPDSSWHKLWVIATNLDTMSSISDTVNVMVDYSLGTGQEIILVANQNSSTLSLIDVMAGNEVYRDVIGVGTTPNDMIYSDGDVYVINSQSHDMNVLDLSYSNEMEQTGLIDIGVSTGSNPWEGAIASNGRMYISNFVTNNVTIVDLETKQAIADIRVGTAPEGILAVGDYIYVCNTGYNSTDWSYGMGSVSIISIVTNLVDTTITLGEGKNPQAMALDMQGLVHVVCTGDYAGDDGEIQIINPSTLQIEYLFIGGSPRDIAITSDGIAYLAAGGWDTDGYVYRYNTVSKQRLNASNDPILVEKGAWNIIVGSDNSVYVSCIFGNTVDKIIAGVRQESWLIGDGPSALVSIKR